MIVNTACNLWTGTHVHCDLVTQSALGHTLKSTESFREPPRSVPSSSVDDFKYGPCVKGYFSALLPCCAFIFLRTYPAVLRTLIFLRTYPAVHLSRFTLPTYPAVRLPRCALIFLRTEYLRCCALTLLCPYPALRLRCCAIIFLRTYLLPQLVSFCCGG